MPEIRCPKPDCRQPYKVSFHHHGQKVKCRKCSTVFSIDFSGSEPVAILSRSSSQSDGEMPAPTVPERLGRFEIREMLGRGAFGVVYKAYDPQLKRVVALKLLQRTGDDKQDARRIRRFLQEGRAAAQLQHPHIVPVFDAGQDIESGEYYLAAAFIEGQTLSGMIEDNPLDCQQAARIIQQLAGAIDYAHSKGILHRDVKPDNVMVDEAGTPYLMDFGLARLEESDERITKDGSLMGTPAYMSPEQVKGMHEELTGASDQYSLGCVLYELLTGRTPFEGPWQTQIHNHLQSPPDDPVLHNTRVPKDLSTICLKCLQKEISRRYGSAGELADDLGRWQEKKPILARRVRSWERMWLWCRRRPVVASSVAVAFTISFIAFLFMSNAEQRTQREQVRTRIASLNLSQEVFEESLKELDRFPPELVLTELRTQFDQASDSQKLSLIFALSHFGDVRIELLISQIDSVSHRQIDNILLVLRIKEDEALRVLETAAQSAERSQDWKLEARLAILALYLNAANRAQEMCQDRPDPTRQTVFIEELTSWHGGLSALVEPVKNSQDAPFRSGVALAIGNVSLENLPIKDQKAWVPIVRNWYQSATDAPTHSAAGFVLRKWKLEIPEIAPSTSPEDDSSWYINRAGITMLKIPVKKPAVTFGDITPQNAKKQVVTSPFFLADREITISQYQNCLDDQDYQLEKPRAVRIESSNGLPVSNVSWSDAVLFCNWLSHREGLTPYYKKTGKTFDQFNATYEEWEAVQDSDGYRLPMRSEWQYACQTDSVTTFNYGEDELLLRRYANYMGRGVEETGSKLPNPWGLFDMYGNVAEYCDLDSSRSTMQTGLWSEQFRPMFLCGGSFSTNNPRLATSKSSTTTSNKYSFTSSSAGFRVARGSQSIRNYQEFFERPILDKLKELQATHSPEETANTICATLERANYDFRRLLDSPDFDYLVKTDRFERSLERYLKRSSRTVRQSIWIRDNSLYDAQFTRFLDELKLVLAERTETETRPSYLSSGEFVTAKGPLTVTGWIKDSTPYRIELSLKRSEFDELSSQLPQQMQLAALEEYTFAGEKRYAGVWVQHAGSVPWEVHERLDVEKTTLLSERMQSQGFRPTYVNAYEDGTLTTIWVQDQGDSELLMGLTYQDMRLLEQNHLSEGTPVCIDSHFDGHRRRYSVVIDRQKRSVDWKFSLLVAQQEMQINFDQHMLEGWYPLSVSLSPLGGGLECMIREKYQDLGGAQLNAQIASSICNDLANADYDLRKVLNSTEFQSLVATDEFEDSLELVMSNSTPCVRQTIWTRDRSTFSGQWEKPQASLEKMMVERSDRPTFLSLRAFSYGKSEPIFITEWAKDSTPYHLEVSLSRQQFEELNSQLSLKMQLVSLEEYSIEDSKRYAALWVQQSEKLPWELHERLDATQTTELKDQMASRGFRPTYVNAYKDGTFTTIWITDPGRSELLLGLKYRDMKLLEQDLASDGMPICVDSYLDGPIRRYCVIIDSQRNSVNWKFSLLDRYDETQSRFDHFTKAGWYPVSTTESATW